MKPVNRSVSLLAVALLLAACSGPPVKTATVPAVAPPATWRTDAGPTTPLDTAWWRQFGDPAMTALVEKALANNTDINVAVSRVRAARANVQIARSALLPTLDANAGALRSSSVSGFGTQLFQSGGQFEVEAAWEVDLFGRLSDQQSAARDAYLASEAARDATRLSVAGATASGYITLLSLDAQLKIAHETLAARADSLRLAKRQFEHGYSSKLQLQQAQAEYESTEQLIPSTELAIAKAENALSLLTDETPSAIERGAVFDALTEPGIPAGLPSNLLRRRPDIAAAEYQLAAADKSLLVARKNFLPQVRLSTALGRSFSTAQIDPITVWSLGGSLLAPLFEGGRLTAEADKAGAQRDEAAFSYRGTVLTAFREVEDALASAQHYDEQLTLVKAQRDTLVETLRIATNRYREGYTTYLDQLDAQRGLLSAQLSVVQIRASALSSRVQLYQAMGGGWSADSIESANAK